MAKRRMGMIGLLMYICLCLIPCRALAASTEDAREMIDPDRLCNLTISYRYEDTAFSEIPVMLYKIADVSSDFQYSLASPFQATGLVLNGIRSNAEWNVIRSTLESHIISKAIPADGAALTDDAGLVRFESLNPGLYLAVPGIGGQCRFDSALIALPGLGSDGLWQYDLTVASKGAPLPPPDAEISYKLLKLWKGDTQSKRPVEIEVEIFRNGERYKVVTLSKDNNWSYSWTAEDDGAQWTVAERNVPSGYTATLEQREAAFILTNTLNTPPPEKDNPKTGDTSNLLLYVMLMYASGISLILLAIAMRKKRL